MGIARNTSAKFSSEGERGQNVGGKANTLPSVDKAVTSVHQNGNTHSTPSAHSSR